MPTLHQFPNFTGPRWAMGSSYFLQQTPGAERLGGMRVKITPRRGDILAIEINQTSLQTKESLVLEPEYTDAVLQGLNEVIKKHQLTEFDIEIDQFLYSKNDAQPRCYYKAAVIALEAALASWQWDQV